MLRIPQLFDYGLTLVISYYGISDDAGSRGGIRNRRIVRDADLRLWPQCQGPGISVPPSAA